MPEDVPQLRVGGVLLRASSVALAALVLCTSALVLAIRFSRSGDGGQCVPAACVSACVCVGVCV